MMFITPRRVVRVATTIPNMAFSQQEQDIIRFGVQNGKTKDQVQQALVNFRTGVKPHASPEVKPATVQGGEPNLLSRVGADIQQAGEGARSAIEGTGANTGNSNVLRGFDASKTVATGVIKTASELLPKPIRDMFDAIGKTVGGIAKAGIDKLSSTKLISEIGQLEADGYINKDSTPELYGVKEALGISSAGGEIAGDILAAKGVADAGNATAKVASDIGTKVIDSTENLISNTADAAQKAGSDLKTKIQTIVAKERVSPQLESSASRLIAGEKPVLDTIDHHFSEATKVVADPDFHASLPEYMKAVQQDIVRGLRAEGHANEASKISGLDTSSFKTLNDFSAVVKQTVSQKAIDPISSYNEYLSKSEKAIKDIKADPPIASVGEDIGKAFKDVVDQRRVVGKVMGSELKAFGSTPVKTNGAFSAFQKELIDNGAKYDAVDNVIKNLPESKFAAQDTQILDYYAGELQKLGSNPTASQLDGFISRIPREIKGLKASSGINFQTNAERLISNNLNGLRDVLGAVATPEYIAARSAYSDLSKFIDEGSGYLGKVTQSGDFARDASLAKSAVQSILNNGKKDWLIQLESLTGKPLLDKAALALQAMKDAGDFRGLSLLQTLSQGSVPLSKTGILHKVLDFALQHGANSIIGSPADQTRRFLNDLVKTGTPTP